jgi:hypothetical protein
MRVVVPPVTALVSSASSSAPNTGPAPIPVSDGKVRGPVSFSNPDIAGRAPWDAGSVLPAAALEKLNEIREEAAEVTAAIHRLSDRRQDTMLDRQRARAALDKIESASLHSEVLPIPSEAATRRMQALPQWQSAKALVDATDAEYARLDARYEELGARQQIALAVKVSCDALAESIAKSKLKCSIWRGTLPKAGDVHKIRSDIQKQKAALAAIAAAPWPSALAVEMIEKYVEDLKAKGTPKLSGLVKYNDAANLQWPTTRVNFPIDPSLTGYVVDSGAVIAWLFGDRLREALLDEVMRFADDKNALTAEQRVEKSKAIEDAILLLERAEEQIIMRERVPRRPDASAVAILGLAVSE